MNTDVDQDLRAILKQLRLSKLMDTLPERLALAKGQKLPHADFLLLVLSDEASRRESLSSSLRAQRAHLDMSAQLEAWDASARVRYDKELLNELASLRFVEEHRPRSPLCLPGRQWGRPASMTRFPHPVMTTYVTRLPRSSMTANTQARPAGQHA